ncbi:MAG TPA: ribonuclease III [Chloroflexota bacterium]|nr:ribonuclease III [Chloroflexota bacterium]
MEATTTSLDQLEARLGVAFHNRELLALALVHQSGSEQVAEGSQAGMPSNERLEFLGDAILGAAAAAYLYHRHPDLAEGPLTALRSALVRRSTVARYAEEIGLGEFVRIGPAETGPQGRGASSVLSAAFEAIVGAIYLDASFSAAAQFLDRFFSRHLPVILDADLHRNAKSELQEFTQGLYRVTPVYRLLERSGPSHDSRFVAEVEAAGLGSARGEGINRRAAEQAAALELLSRLRAGIAANGAVATGEVVCLLSDSSISESVDGDE